MIYTWSKIKLWHYGAAVMLLGLTSAAGVGQVLDGPGGNTDAQSTAQEAGQPGVLQGHLTSEEISRAVEEEDLRHENQLKQIADERRDENKRFELKIEQIKESRKKEANRHNEKRKELKERRKQGENTDEEERKEGEFNTQTEQDLQDEKNKANEEHSTHVGGLQDAENDEQKTHAVNIEEICRGRQPRPPHLPDPEPGPLPVPVPPHPQPAPLPGASPVNKLTFWISAFIPKVLQSQNPWGKTVPVPEKGGGRSTIPPERWMDPGINTMVLGPPNPFFWPDGYHITGYLTDQRSWDNHANARARLHAEVDINVNSQGAVALGQQRNRCDETTALDVDTGEVLCHKASGTGKIGVTVAWKTRTAMMIKVNAEAENPCVPGPVPAPDIKVTGNLIVDVENRRLFFLGAATQFPAMEMYASLNGEKEGRTILRKPPDTEKSPIDLFAGTTDQVDGRLDF